MTAYALFSLIGWTCVGIWFAIAAFVVLRFLLNRNNPARWL